MIDRDELDRIKTLRASTGLPVTQCRRCVSEAPPGFLDAIIAGADCRETLIDYTSRGIAIPCPKCGSAFTATARYGGCPNGCNTILWTATLASDRIDFDNLFENDV